MECAEARELLADLLNGDFDGPVRNAIQQHVDQCQECQEEFERTKEVTAAVEAAHEEPVVTLFNEIAENAIDSRASDIHFQCSEDGLRVRYRVDGALRDARKLEAHVWPALLTRIQVLSEMNLAERRLPQDGRIHVRFREKGYDLRVSFLPTASGGQVVARILSQSAGLFSLDQLGFSQIARKQVEALLGQPAGLTIVTGPTGAGKTTTLYAMLTHADSPARHVLTVEDPVEYRLPGVGQTPVNRRAGLSFANALRAMMRQDPDIIMVGEIRDLETVEIVIQATLTGHLLLSTLHTNDAASAPQRLLDMGVEPFLITNSLSGVVAQRLVRCVCEACKEETDLPAEVRRTLADAGVSVTSGTFCRGAGCDKCANSGYRGRTAVHEVMTMTPALSELILRRADTKALRDQALKDGMVSMLEDGVRKAAEGVTTIEEVLRVVPRPE